MKSSKQSSSSGHHIRKLEIKIPNFSHSQEKEDKTIPSKPVKSKSNISTSQRVYTQRSRDLSKDYQKHVELSLSTGKDNAYRKKSPSHQVLQSQALTRLYRMRVGSKSPRSKGQSPRQRNQPEKYSNPAFQTNVTTSKNIQDVRKKLETLSSRGPMKLTGKYFRKEQRMPGQLQDMNRTLKRMTEMKTSKKPRYELKMIRRVGKSQTGDIILAISNINGMVVAIKTFKKDKIKLQFLIDQMKIHLYCTHPNILPAYGYHIGREEVFLVMEYGYCNLYQQILRDGPFSQEKTARYIGQILSGVEYLHRNGVIHRDLKPENVICFADHLKITDFGWSIKTQTQRRTLCGTLDYISPEVAQRNYYDNKIDCWSIGVLMYQMLTVQPPFSQNGKNYDFRQLALPSELSKQGTDFISLLLKVQPKERMSARQALEHQWLKSNKKNGLLLQRRQVKNIESEIHELFRQEI